MRTQGYTDAQIFKEVKGWHPEWDDTKITQRTGILGGGPTAEPPGTPQITPSEKPTFVPALKPYGVQQSIGTTNQDVQAIVDAHARQMGYKPSAALVFDLLKAKPLLGMEPDWAHLFAQVPSSQRDAIAKGAATSPPGQYERGKLYTRADGLMVQPHMPGIDPTSLTALHDKYPTVEAGMFPGPLADKFFHALATITDTPDNLPVTSLGQTLQQAESTQRLAQGSDITNIGRITNAREAVRTVQQAQHQLNQWMGTHLPEDGFFNANWQKAYSDWTKTKDYYERAAQFQAKQAGAKDYASYLKAFKTKQHQVHKHGLIGYFLNTLPVMTFSDGGGFLGVAKELATRPFANPQFDPSYPLHALTRTGGELLDVSSGAVGQVKIDAAAGNAFMNELDKGHYEMWFDSNPDASRETLNKAKARASKILSNDHPSWLQVFYPDLPDDPKGKLKVISEITNVAGDLILLRKATWTGADLEAGDLVAAKKSVGLNRHAHFAFNDLYEGNLHGAASILEGGSGAERLAAAAAPAIKKGRMTEEQFAHHVAELYSKGHTTIVTLPKEKPGMIEVYHGTPHKFENYNPAESEVNQHGKVIYSSDNPSQTNVYTRLPGGGDVEKIPGPAKSVGFAPHVNLHRLDLNKTLDLTVKPESAAAKAESNVHLLPDLEDNAAHSVKVPKSNDLDTLKKKTLAVLTPQERKVIPTLETAKWDDIKDNKDLYDFLTVMGSAMEHDAGVTGEARTYGRSFANDVIQRLGYQHMKTAGNEYVTFQAEHLLPRFEKPIEVRVEGPLLASFRGSGLATPGKAALTARQTVRNALDSFDKGMKASGVPGTDNVASMMAHVRSSFSHAVPASPRGYFDPKLPERVHDFVLSHFDDAELANKYASEVVRARAAGNVPRLQKIEARLQSAYYRKYSLGPGTPYENDPFSPLLKSEAGSRFHFPAGNRQPVENPFDAISVTATGINRRLNKIGGILRRVMILSPSLFWKHAIGDTLRRIVTDPGVMGKLSESRAEITALINDSPELARRWGTFLDRTTNSEVHYIADPNEQARSFNTKQFFNNKNYMRGAGRTLRQMLDDEALTAYRASNEDNLQPLADMIMHDPTYRRLWSAQQKKAAIRIYGEDAVREGKFTSGKIEESTYQRVLTTIDRKEMYAQALPIEQYANLIYNRYKRLEEAARAADTSLEDARTVLRNARGGGADDALGSWIADNGVDFHIDNALVTTGSNLDTLSAGAVKKVMSPNKKNREIMAKNVAYATYRDLRAAGWDQREALHTAMDLAEKQTIYHMLDFSNMLKIEQDMRWLVMFATKHRLYWKWVASTLVRRPGTAALISDVQQHLDGKGNFNFEVLGHKLAIPAARLVWVPGKEYPETSPLAGGLAEFIKSGFDAKLAGGKLAGPVGTGIQRSVVPAKMLIRLAQMDAGSMPATYEQAASGMDPTNARYLRRAINHFQMDYFAAHGHYAPQAEAVKHALLTQAADSLWRSNLPLPVIPQNPNDTQKLLNQYMAIHDPVKRSAFLDAHPELALSFGVSQNPTDYVHLQTFWGQFTNLIDARNQVREEIYQQAKKQGFMDQKLETLRHKADAEFNKELNGLKAKDLAATPLAQRKEINGDMLGIWGQQLSADPLTNPAQALKQMFPHLSDKSLSTGTPSKLIKDAKRELELLQDPAWVAKTFQTPDEARTRKRELLQFIQDFNSYPSDPLGKVERQYLVDHVNPYWKHVESYNAQIALMGRGAKDLAYAKLRAWKDQQDHPVVVGGIKFPSPVAAAWENLPPDLRKQRIAALATGSWDHLANYEKKLLGYTPAPGVSQGWETYTESVAAYHAQYPGKTLAKNQKDYLVQAIDKQNPGFAKDYKFAQLPGIQRFEQLAPYKEMPPKVKALWDEEIAPNAHVIAKAYASGNYRQADLRQAWENYVKSDILPFVNQHTPLRKFLAPYMIANPDFLNTLTFP